MKRWLCALLAAALTACAWAFALAAGSDSYADIAGTYVLSSGVGAWYTQLTVNADGSFSGYYQDSDLGSGDPNGDAYESTLYCGAFRGMLGDLDRFGVWELDCGIDTLTWDDGPSRVEDRTLIVPSPPSGLNAGDRLRFFDRGASLGTLPEGFLVWVRMREGEIAWDSLPYDAMYNETADAGFSGVTPEAAPWTPEPADSAPTASVEWSFFTGEAFESAAPQAEATPVPAPAATRDGEAAPGFEGIEYPVQAEVVNCTTGVSLREKPSTKAALLAEVPLGALATVYSNAAYSGNGRWFVEAGYNGQRGYICIEYLDILLPDALAWQRDYLKGLDGTVSAVNRGTDLILRAGPGTGYDSLGLLFGGEVLGYRGEAKRDADGDCWYRCSHYGEDCWISAAYTVLTMNDGKTYTGRKGIF